MELSDKIKSLSTSPGVYQFYDVSGNLLYVGKARNLKNRVSSYFRQHHDYGKTRVLVKKIADVQVIVVDTELDALLLENSLIKKHQPRYNINLKDDKTYPWICIKNERFPRIFPTRQKINDGSQYFGPYANVKMMHTLLDLVRKVYKLRTCRYDLSPENIEKRKFKVCLEYHLGNCKGPCEGLQEEEDYLIGVEDIKSILKGNIRSVKNLLKEKMDAYAADLDFERAHLVKEKIDLLEMYQSKSTVVSPVIKNIDVVSMMSEMGNSYFNYMKVIDGAIIRSHTLEFKSKVGENPEELMDMAMVEFSSIFGDLAKEVIVSTVPETNWPGINFVVPQKGEKKKLLELSERNARYYMMEKARQEKISDPEKHTLRMLEQMKGDLRLSELPVHIECFDNSNFQGTNAVAACVVFKNLKPSKKDYRHFNIKTVTGPDDYASMREVVFRRYNRLILEDQPLPQLIVIDGGKGQLNAALESINKLNLRGKIALVGIAKRLEEIYFPGDPLPLYIDKKSPSLKVIQHLRNEAHRFGITHHRQKRSKSAIQSELEKISGIGEKTIVLLLKHFKSVSKIKEASREEIEKVAGKSKAGIVYNYFKGENA